MNEEIKHTPGPWVAIPGKVRFNWGASRPLFDDGLWHVLPAANLGKIPICSVDHADDHDAPTRAKSEADAYLIASAPDLLDFVKTLENDDNKIPAWLWDKRNALIAKAEGRDQ